jgi:hypothetical protein
MSSRDYLKHTLSNSRRATNPGDEYWDSVGNKLYKNVLINGTTATNLEVLTTISQSAPGTNNIGYQNIPQIVATFDYTLVLSDSGKHIYHPATDAVARTYTIPANETVSFPIGTTVIFINDTSGVNVSIACTTDTLMLAGTGTTGTRTLAQNGIATIIKITSTKWVISGAGLT